MDTAELDRDVRLSVLEMFIAEQNPSVERVAARLRATPKGIALAFERLAAGRAFVLAPGTHDILMAAPFAGTPTDFRVRSGDHSWFANCIWDALGIPAMLAGAGRFSDAQIGTHCPDCEQALSVTVRDGLVSSEPDDVVVHFAVPASKWWADIVFT